MSATLDLAARGNLLQRFTGPIASATGPVLISPSCQTSGRIDYGNATSMTPVPFSTWNDGGAA